MAYIVAFLSGSVASLSALSQLCMQLLSYNFNESCMQCKFRRCIYMLIEVSLITCYGVCELQPPVDCDVNLDSLTIQALLHAAECMAYNSCIASQI